MAKKGNNLVLDKELREKADKKVSKDGWLRAAMMIEVLAANRDAAKSALEKHVDSLAGHKQVILYKREYSDIEKIENPLPKRPDIKEAYSYVVEVECALHRYEDLIAAVMTYGPSSVEILEPSSLKLELGEAQGIVNTIADMIHKFVAAGVGGIIVKS